MEITVQKIAQWQKEKKPFYLLDVRTPEEREIANIGGDFIPLQELEQRYTELSHQKTPLIVYCHHGVRSLYATQFLKMHGYDALSLRGGIDLWSLEIDPKVPRY